MAHEWVKFLDDLPGRKIIRTEGNGKVTPDEVKWATEELVKRGKKYSGKWAYMPNIEKLAPIIDPESQKLFAEMHVKLEAAGCVALTFVVGGTVAIKVQAQRHQQASEVNKLVAEYFRTEEDALKWLKESFNI